MTPQRMRDAAQILGELGNGKMANELSKLADHIEVEEQLHKIAPNLQKANNSGDFLGKIAESAKAHYDALGQPYPEHLHSLLSYLESA